VASTSEELFAAIEAGDAERVRAIVDADPALASSRDVEGVSALLRARYRFDDPMVDAIRPHVAGLDVFEAATFGDVDRLDELLDADPSLARVVSGDGFTPLHLAAFFGGGPATRRLLTAGADADAHGRGWMTGTPLQSAVTSRDHASIELLLAAGADPNSRQGQGWTPMHSAAHHGDLAAIAMLRAAGADPSLTNDDGRAPADLAVDDVTRAALG
jgi:ankyrin repeat protein